MSLSGSQVIMIDPADEAAGGQAAVSVESKKVLSSGASQRVGTKRPQTCASDCKRCEHVHCPACGRQRVEAARYCPGCGWNFSAAQRGSRNLTVAGAAAAVAVIAAAAVLAPRFFPPHPSVSRSSARPTLTVPSPTATPAPEAAESSYGKIRQSLAMVVAPGDEGESLGSGFCVASTPKRAYFLTNHHVVGNASRVQLLLPGRHRLIAATVAAVGDDKEDLAVLAVNVGSQPIVHLASHSPTEGRSIAVAGYPSIQFRLAEGGLGLSPSMHVGTVNALPGDGYYIEYDAQSDHGNSGGPLYDVETADVYGIVTLGIPSTSSGAVQNNLAIGIAEARDLIAEAMQQPTPVVDDRSPPVAALEAPSRQGTSPPQSAVSPSTVVRQFYALINDGNFQAAYALLSPDFRQQSPYDRWHAGYATTVQSEAQVEDSDDPSNVPVRLTAVDRTTNGRVTAYYAGSWSLVPDGRGSWLLDTGRLRRVASL